MGNEEMKTELPRKLIKVVRRLKEKILKLERDEYGDFCYNGDDQFDRRS